MPIVVLNVRRLYDWPVFAEEKEWKSFVFRWEVIVGAIQSIAWIGVLIFSERFVYGRDMIDSDEFLRFQSFKEANLIYSICFGLVFFAFGIANIRKNIPVTAGWTLLISRVIVGFPVLALGVWYLYIQRAYSINHVLYLWVMFTILSILLIRHAVNILSLVTAVVQRMGKADV